MKYSRKKNYTIIDIAKLSGFSRSTVSKVIRNEPYVKKSTKEVIENVIMKIDYHPDEVARSLVSKKRLNFIGLIISDITNPFFSEIALAAENEAKRNGYNLILCNTNYVEEEEKKYIEILIANRASGILLATPTMYSKNLEELIIAKQPYVLITRQVQGVDSNIVLVDHYKSAKNAVNYLIKKGHRRIAHFTGTNNISGVIERFEGYKAALKENDIKFNDNLVFRSGISNIEAGYISTQEMLELDEKPTAIFASDDLLAIGALDYLLKSGYKIPDDFSIIGYDNIKITSLKPINLTTVDQPKSEMGVKAVEILLKQITSKEKVKTIKCYLKSKIIERGSVLDLNLMKAKI